MKLSNFNSSDLMEYLKQHTFIECIAGILSNTLIDLFDDNKEKYKDFVLTSNLEAEISNNPEWLVLVMSYPHTQEKMGEPELRKIFSYYSLVEDMDFLEDVVYNRETFKYWSEIMNDSWSKQLMPKGSIRFLDLYKCILMTNSKIMKKSCDLLRSQLQKD